jgi:high-affinity iron transporter
LQCWLGLPNLTFVIWSLALPNLLIGLREGLEAGLIVTILLGALRKLAPDRGAGAIWLGVLSAATLSLSFGAVLTFTRAELEPRAQEIFGGTLSLLAVVLVTTMIFWMRNAARSISGELRGRISDALTAGGAAVAVTAFVSVAREGLETALFVWTNAQAAGSSTSPLLGAVLGLAIAMALCTLLYRRVLKINLSRFFTVTGAALTVVVAGVLAYGIGDLQGSAVLPGASRTAFDLSGHVNGGSWWVEAVRGVTNLDTRMSWLQVLGYLGYLAVVLPLFLIRRGGAAPAARPAAASAPASAAIPAPAAAGPAGSARPVGPRRWRPARPGGRRLALGALLVLPVAVAAGWVALDHGGRGGGASPVTLTADSCAADWTTPRAGSQTYAVTNSAGRAADVELVQDATGAIVAEIEVLGPGTTRNLPVTLGSGSFRWTCAYDGLPTLRSTVKTLNAAAAQAGSGAQTAAALIPTTAADLAPALRNYASFVRTQLGTVQRQLVAMTAAIRGGDRAAARTAWLAAHLAYHRIGAAYGAFGAEGDAVDGLAAGLPLGKADPDFAGFHRVELGLWSAAPLAAVLAPAAALQQAVTTLDAQLDSFTFEPNEVSTRAHEILEDTLRFTLTGQDDYGSGSGFLTAQADLDGDRYLLDLLAPLLQQRSPGLTVAANAQLSTLQRALTAAGRGPVGQADRATRQRVDAATSGLLETLAPIPDVLEVRAP